MEDCVVDTSATDHGCMLLDNLLVSTLCDGRMDVPAKSNTGLGSCRKNTDSVASVEVPTISLDEDSGMFLGSDGDDIGNLLKQFEQATTVPQIADLVAGQGILKDDLEQPHFDLDMSALPCDMENTKPSKTSKTMKTKAKTTASRSLLTRPVQQTLLIKSNRGLQTTGKLNVSQDDSEVMRLLKSNKHLFTRIGVSAPASPATTPPSTPPPDMIRKIKSSATKRKSAILLPSAVPAKGERGQAVQLVLAHPLLHRSQKIITKSASAGNLEAMNSLRDSLYDHDYCQSKKNFGNNKAALGRTIVKNENINKEKVEVEVSDSAVNEVKIQGSGMLKSMLLSSNDNKNDNNIISDSRSTNGPEAADQPPVWDGHTLNDSSCVVSTEEVVATEQVTEEVAVGSVDDGTALLIQAAMEADVTNCLNQSVCETPAKPESETKDEFVKPSTEQTEATKSVQNSIEKVLINEKNIINCKKSTEDRSTTSQESTSSTTATSVENSVADSIDIDNNSCDVLDITANTEVFDMEIDEDENIDAILEVCDPNTGKLKKPATKKISLEQWKRKRKINDNRKYRKRSGNKSPSPVVDSNNFFDKVPSYYTALSLTHASTKQLKKSGSSAKLVDASLPDRDRDPSPKRDDSYNKLPAYFSCFTNSTKYDSKVPDGSDPLAIEHENNCAMGSMRSQVGSRSQTPTRLRGSSRSGSPHSRCSSASSRSSSRRRRSRSRSCSYSYGSRSRSRSRSRSQSRQRHRSRSPLHRSRSRSRNHSWSRSCSRSPTRTGGRSKYRKEWDQTRRSRSRSRRRRLHERKEAKKRQQMKERRIVYVGRIHDDCTRAQLHRWFERFGEIIETSVHFRECGDNYGFVTFAYTCDAYAALEKGRQVPGCERFDLCFGGRRQFCKVDYADLDGNVEMEEEMAPVMSTNKKQDDFDFDALLKMATKQMNKK